MTRLWTLVALVACCAAASAQDAKPALPAPVLESLIKEPDYAKAWDLVFLAEGYPASEQELFFEQARLMARKLRFGNTSFPMREAYTFNFHFVFAASREAVSWKPGGKPRDSRLRSYTDEDGVLVTDDALADALALEVAPDVDSIVIVARFQPASAYDVSTWPKALSDVVEKPDHVRANADMPSDGKRARMPTIDPDAFVHELGHALFGLGDEYGEYDGALPASGHWEIALTPNLTTDPSGARWRHIVDSVFEGGGYYATGVYRPEQACRMRESREAKFCAVCAHTIRSIGAVEEPSEAKITSPKQGKAVEPGALLSPSVEVAWKQAHDPLYYAIELYDAAALEASDEATPLWDDYVEGHLRSFEVPVSLAHKGALTVRIFPTNYKDESADAAEVTFKLKKLAGGAVPSTTGVSGAVDPTNQ
ncbi:MAG: hypothetical protein KDD82_29420 [Planctomycetes bacterium]|nr:hypothetical protein [Planctomycetota bacterium]